MLIGHGIWVAENYGVIVEVLRLWIIFQLVCVEDEWFLGCREEHRVDFHHFRGLMHFWIIFNTELPNFKVRFQFKGCDFILDLLRDRWDPYVRAFEAFPEYDSHLFALMK